MKYPQPTLPLLELEARLEARDFDRRILTVRAMGALAVELVASSRGPALAERYADELWDYRQLRQFSKEAGYPEGTAPQVFSRWHQLISRDLDILPITFESAKRWSYDLSLLGAAVTSGLVETPVTKELLGQYHDFQLEGLTTQA